MIFKRGGGGNDFFRQYNTLSSKLKRVSLNQTPELPFWGLCICVDNVLRDSKKFEKMKKLNKIIFHSKNIDIDKTAFPYS